MRKNTRSRKYNYYSKETWQKKSLQLATDIDKYIDVALEQQHFNKLIDFDLLHKTIDHMKEVNQLLSLNP
jgi:hypothetical protein